MYLNDLSLCVLNFLLMVLHISPFRKYRYVRWLWCNHFHIPECTIGYDVPFRNSGMWHCYDPSSGHTTCASATMPSSDMPECEIFMMFSDMIICKTVIMYLSDMLVCRNVPFGHAGK